MPWGVSASITVGDFNADSRPDLVGANSADNQVSVLLGDGSGDFGATTNFGVGTYPSEVAVGDFNADSRLDLGVTNGEDDTVAVLLGDGRGGLGPVTNFPVGDFPSSVAVNDFNEDLRPDLAVTNAKALSFNVSVLLNTTFVQPYPRPGGGTPFASHSSLSSPNARRPTCPTSAH